MGNDATPGGGFCSATLLDSGTGNEGNINWEYRPVEEKEELVPNQFVEFKTCQIVDTEWRDRNFRKFKLIKWWAQSFLGNRNIRFDIPFNLALKKECTGTVYVTSKISY
jgi:RAI1 like PD-(D/E)XK nuclease